MQWHLKCSHTNAGGVDVSESKVEVKKIGNILGAQILWIIYLENVTVTKTSLDLLLMRRPTIQLVLHHFVLTVD